MGRQRRLMALLMCLAMLLVWLASSAYIAHEANHDCTGEDCPICAFIARSQEALRGLALALAALLAFLAPAAARSHLCAAGSAPFACATPVRLKTRLNC